MKNGLGPRTMVVGLVVGVFSIPALVYAATMFLGPTDTAATDTTVAAAAPVVVTTTIPETTTTAAPTTTVPIATQADLERACGEDGLTLVAAEAEGTITELEQAALDALRPICEDAGLALPGPAAPDPVVVVETVTAPATGSGGSTTTTVASSGSGYDDDHGDDDHDDEYEDDDDHGDDDHDDDDDHGGGGDD